MKDRLIFILKIRIFFPEKKITLTVLFAHLIGMHLPEHSVLPTPLHLAEVEGARSVGGDLLPDVLSVATHVIRHVISWNFHFP